MKEDGCIDTVDIDNEKEAKRNPHGAENVEHRVSESCASSVGVCADSRERRRNRRSDVVAENDGNRGPDRDNTAVRECDGDSDRGRRTLDNHRTERADCNCSKNRKNRHITATLTGRAVEELEEFAESRCTG